MNRIKPRKTKLVLYTFSTGTTEIKYIRKLVDNHFGDYVEVEEIADAKIDQLQESNNRDTIKKIVTKINNVNPKAYSGIHYVLIITDLDNATLEQIQYLYTDIKSRIGNLFFILNKRQFESWLKFYPDFFEIKDEKHKVEFIKSISDNWDKVFKSSHKQAKNNYFTVTDHCKDEKCENYDLLDKNKDYSDFPHFLKFLEEKTGIRI